MMMPTHMRENLSDLNDSLGDAFDLILNLLVRFEKQEELQEAYEEIYRILIDLDSDIENLSLEMTGVGL